MAVTLRQMIDADVAPATLAQVAAFEALDLSSGVTPRTVTDDVLTRMHGRYRHFLDHDPAGAWVAIEDDRVAGAALGLKREQFWGLSLMFVDPSAQSSGVGRRLMDAALTYAEGCRQLFILSTHDPRAMRLYATSDFTVHPQIEGVGEPDRSALPAPHRTVRDGSLADVEFADTVDRVVRGAPHGPDQIRMATDLQMFVVDDVDGRGYAYLREDGLLYNLAATDDDTARALLWRCLATVSDLGRCADVYHLNAEQQWAIEICYRARLRVTPGGSAFWRGGSPPRAYLPSGAYL